MNSQSYDEFLSGKVVRQIAFGKRIEPSDIHPMLFPFQRDVTTWAGRKGRCAIFLDTGLGKSFAQIEWARLLGEKTLIIAPLSVARQTVREGRKIDLDVHYVRGQDEVVGDDKLWITNYEMIEHFDLATGWGAVVLDECFVGDTLVDTETGTKRIDSIVPGEMVYTATGLQKVKAVKTRYKDSLVLTSIQGRVIISSVNHPFFTQRGWVGAQDLQEDDCVIYTTEAMRVARVRETVDGEADEAGESFLRAILLGEMENEPARNIGESSLPRSSSQTGEKKECLVQGGKPNSSQGTGTNTPAKPDVQSRIQEEVVGDAQADRTQAQNPGREWTPDANSSKDASGRIGGGLDRGIRAKSRETDVGLPNTLQDRYCQPANDGSNRSRWIQPCCDEKACTGRQKGEKVAGARVDSVAIYQSSNPIFTRYRDETGRVALYDLEIEGHPSFSVHGLLVHNSSILKAISGKTRKKLTSLCQNIPYRLCCTATPAPNDYIELGNHAEFLGICTRSEMLAMFFINANKEHTFFVNGKAYRKKGSNKAGQEWRLKHHAEEPFFQWLASWAITMTKPSDLGYSDEGFILPPLNIHKDFVTAQYKSSGQLFFTHIKGIAHQAEVRRQTLPQRLSRLKELVNANGKEERWIIWVGLDAESKAATREIEGAIEVKGSDTPEYKARTFEEFQDGKHRVLVTKARVGGFGMNFQVAHKMAFLGLGHSQEQYYQCIRREWRYLQEHPVDVHIIMSDIEAPIYHNVMRKDAQARRLREGLIEQIGTYAKEELNMTIETHSEYNEDTVRGKGWTAMLGDACTRLAELEEDSVDLSAYSPPFADLFTYSPSSRDLGNSRNWDEFLTHYKFIIQEILRVTKPGRLTCVHTSDIPALAQKDGYIGVRDFPGAVIRAYEEEGWVFHGRAFVQKCPQAQAIRTHSKGLLFVQLRKDSAASRPALIDQILIFRKEGDNAVPITPVENGEMDNETWIEWAHGIWTGISETDTLQKGPARAADDEKHICPLQLPTIERCIKLYSNPGETVLSPFGGIGSEGYVAIQLGRKAILIELKKEYFEVLVNNLKKAESEANMPDLFGFAGVEV